MVSSLSITGNHPFTITRTYEAQRNLLTSIEAKWSTASRTRFDYTSNALYQRISKQQSGDVFADYGNSTFDRYTYDARGELIQGPGYLGTDVTDTTHPLPGRFHEYAYDSIGNRSTANRTGVPSLQDNYTSNALNQYVSKENNTVPVQGTVDSASTTVTVAGGSSTAGQQGRYWADEVTANNTSGPWSGPISLFATKPNAGGAYINSATVNAQVAKALQSFTYDADGNLTSDGLWDYQYDAENRLIRMMTTVVARTAGFPNRIMDYRYDFKGRRVQKRVLDGGTAAEISSRRYLYQGWNLIAEWNAPGGTAIGTLVRSYTWGLDLAGSLTNSGGVGGLLQITDQASGKTFLPTYDGNGNVAALLNGSTGAVAAAYEYDPSGNLLRNQSPDATVADQPFKFSTKITDQETGLVYYGSRFYSPNLGRFINRDPIEEAGGLNLYGFCLNDGINAYDFAGMRLQFPDMPDDIKALRALHSDAWWDSYNEQALEFQQQMYNRFSRNLGNSGSCGSMVLRDPLGGYDDTTDIMLAMQAMADFARNLDAKQQQRARDQNTRAYPQPDGTTRYVTSDPNSVPADATVVGGAKVRLAPGTVPTTNAVVVVTPGEVSAPVYQGATYGGTGMTPGDVSELAPYVVNGDDPNSGGLVQSVLNGGASSPINGTTNFTVTTTIRPPDFEAGQKSGQTVIVDNGSGLILNRTSSTGTTSVFGLFDLSARTSFTSGFSSTSTMITTAVGPVIQVNMTGETGSKAFPANINYNLNISFNPTMGSTTLGGGHDGYPSYSVFQNGALISDYQQTQIWKLIGTGNEPFPPVGP